MVITTGFAVAPGLPETDGPPGAASLGRALRQLGAEVIFVTDAVTVPPLSAALTALGEPRQVETFHASAEQAEAQARRLLAGLAATHVVAIERPGRTRDGDYKSARALSVAAWNGPLDALVLAAPRRVVTVGVGDGGNEVGMGNVYAKLVKTGGRMREIASVVKVHHLVVAGTSNWGAYGIVAALSRLAGRDLLHSGEEERAMVEACVAAGAVDGLTKKPEPTVDALPLAAHVGMLELLRVTARPDAHDGPVRPAARRVSARAREASE